MNIHNHIDLQLLISQTSILRSVNQLYVFTSSRLTTVTRKSFASIKLSTPFCIKGRFAHSGSRGESFSAPYLPVSATLFCYRKQGSVSILFSP